MKVFVINLEKNPERLTFVSTQLNTLGVMFDRIDAIYGKELSKDDLKQKANRFRWWCAMGCTATPGEIGCALSHTKVYQQMIDENLPYACILEDDVKIAPEFPAILKRLEKWLNVNESQVVVLSAHDAPHKLDFSLESISWAFCTDGYVLSQKAARAILSANSPVVSVADAWGRWVKRDLIQLWRCYPTTITQQNDLYGSDITFMPHGSLATWSFFKRLWYYWKRLWGISIDFLYWVVIRQ